MIKYYLTKTKLNIKKDCYNVDIARNIKKKTSLLVRCSGRIDYNHATKLINSKKIDLICVGREFIKNPNWLIKVLKDNLINWFLYVMLNYCINFKIYNNLLFVTLC